MIRRNNRVGMSVYVMRVAGWIAVIVLGTGVMSSAQNLPDGDGRAILQSACTQCHDLSSITDLRLDRAAWENVVAEMMSLGASMEDSEVDVVVTYLAAHFGAEAGAGTATVRRGLPAGTGVEAVRLACGRCHGTEKITRLKADRSEWELIVYDMIARGAPIYDEEMDGIINYLGANFGK